MHKRLHQILSIVAATLIVAGCASTTTDTTKLPPNVTTTGRSLSYAGPAFRTILVVGLNPMQLVDQRGLENVVVSTLMSASTVAFPAYQFIPPNPRPDTATIKAAVAKSGADAVLLIRSTTFSPESTAINLMAPDVPVGALMYGGWYDPIAQEDYQVARIYTTLFNVATGRAVWTYNPPSYTPATLQQNAVVFANDVVDRLQQQGLIITK